MVAVADCQLEIRPAFRKKRPHPVKRGVRRRSGEQIALQSAAAQHQLEVIELMQASVRFFECTNHRILRVVEEQHDMRRFQRGGTAHGNAGRNALQHSTLGGAHRRG